MPFDNDKDEIVRETLERIERMKNIAGTRLFNTDQEQSHQLKILIDKSLPHGRFFPTENAGEWKASEQTYKAMKKNLFALGDSFEELKEPYACESCKTDLDKQFWHFCPFCGESFRSE